MGGLEKDATTSAISTDPVNHQKMVDIRKNKIEYIANCVEPLKVEGDENADTLVIGWGGTYGHLVSAVEEMNAMGKKTALAHFRYINPLPANTEEVIRRYKNVVVCELNNGQFATHLVSKIEGLQVKKFNKVQGQPFMVSELVDFLKSL